MDVSAGIRKEHISKGCARSGMRGVLGGVVSGLYGLDVLCVTTDGF